MVRWHCVHNFWLSWDLSQWTKSDECKYITSCSNFRFSSKLFQWTETEQCWASQIWNTSHCVKCFVSFEPFPMNWDWRMMGITNTSLFTGQWRNNNNYLFIFVSRAQWTQSCFQNKIFTHVHLNDAYVHRSNWHAIWRKHTGLITSVAAGFIHSDQQWWQGTPTTLTVTVRHSDAWITLQDDSFHPDSETQWFLTLQGWLISPWQWDTVILE